MEQILTLIKGDKVGDETDYRDALPVNMIAVAKPLFGIAGYMLQSPGLTQYGNSAGVSRGGLWNERQSNLYRVQGNQLVSVSNDGAVANLVTITGSDTVSLPYSFKSLKS